MSNLLPSKLFRKYSFFYKNKNPRSIKGGEAMDKVIIPEEMKPSIKEILDVLDKNYFEVLAERDGKKTARRKTKNIVSYKEISDVLDKNTRIVRNEFYGENI